MSGILYSLLPGLESLLPEVALKGTVFLSIAMALVLALRSASAASRHLVWTLALGATLALPVVSLTLPAWKVAVFSSSEPIAMSKPMQIERNFAANAADAQASEVPGTGQTARPAMARWVLLLWGIGVIFCLGRMAVGEVRVRRMVEHTHHFQATHANSLLENVRRRLGIFRSVELRTSPDIAVPFTRGIFRPAIILPEEGRGWPQEQFEYVLAHELAHVCRHDCLTQLPAQFACALLWFHPLVWFAAFQMRKERERACDDVVLNVGHHAADYAEFLLALGRRLQRPNPVWSTTVAMSQPSQLEVRMKALLDPKLNRRPLTASRALFAAVLTMALLVPAAVIHASAGNDTGSISGTVHDPSGAVVPGAGVILISSRTQTRIASHTGEDGTFSFPEVPAGRYQLEFAKPGFARTLTGEFELGPSRELHQNFTLNLGWVSEELVVRGHRPATLAPAPTRTPHRIRVGGLVQAAKLVKIVKPAYPAGAEKQGTEGTVILRAVIGTSGQVLSLEPYNDADPALTEAAMEAVRQWRYQPTLLNGVPVEVATTITVTFRLD
ncbi:MAG TPA: M56 family metallopeptidase [Terriglobia bacterium]|nr:M56 family metallopeptidase [Terriglobia bacterium]